LNIELFGKPSFNEKEDLANSFSDKLFPTNLKSVTKNKKAN